jgi:hypothetical protein
MAIAPPKTRKAGDPKTAGLNVNTTRESRNPERRRDPYTVGLCATSWSSCFFLLPPSP